MTTRILPVLLVLAAAAARAEAPSDCDGPNASIAVLDPDARNVPADMVAEVGEVVARSIASTAPFRVMSRQDVRRLIANAAAQQAAAGSDDAMNAIGAAVGACYLVSSSIGIIEQDRVYSMGLFDVRAARSLGRSGRRLDPGETFIGVLGDAAKVLVSPLLRARGGTLLVRANEEGAEIVFDDAVIGQTPSGPLAVPGGTHDVLLRKKGFIPLRRTVEIRAGVAETFDALLLPSADYAREHRAANRLKRRVAWAGTIAALAAGAGAGYFGWSYSDKQSGVDSQVAAWNRPENLVPEDSEEAARRTEWRRTESNAATRERWFATGAGTVGVAAAVAAAYFFLSGDDPDRYKAYASEP